MNEKKERLIEELVNEYNWRYPQRFGVSPYDWAMEQIKMIKEKKMNKNEKEFFELELAFLKCRRDTIDKRIEEVSSKLKAEEEKKTFFELLDMVLENGYPKEIKTETAVYAIKEVRKDLNHIMDNTDYVVKDDSYYYEDILSEIADDYTFSELLTYKGFIAIY